MIRHLGLKASSNISVRAPVHPSVRSFVRRLMPQFIINGPGFTSSRQAGSGHQISIMQPKLAGCSQWSEANIKQRSFHFQWAIMQQHLDEGPYETLVFFFFFSLPVTKHCSVTSTLTLHTPWLSGKGIPACLVDTQPGSQPTLSPTRYLHPFLIC